MLLTAVVVQMSLRPRFQRSFFVEEKEDAIGGHGLVVLVDDIKDNRTATSEPQSMQFAADQTFLCIGVDGKQPLNCFSPSHREATSNSGREGALVPHCGSHQAHLSIWFVGASTGYEMARICVVSKKIQMYWITDRDM